MIYNVPPIHAAALVQPGDCLQRGIESTKWEKPHITLQEKLCENTALYGKERSLSPFTENSLFGNYLRRTVDLLDAGLEAGYVEPVIRDGTSLLRVSASLFDAKVSPVETVDVTFAKLTTHDDAVVAKVLSLDEVSQLIAKGEDLPYIYLLEIPADASVLTALQTSPVDLFGYHFTTIDALRVLPLNELPEYFHRRQPVTITAEVNLAEEGYPIHPDDYLWKEIFTQEILLRTVFKYPTSIKSTEPFFDANYTEERGFVRARDTMPFTPDDASISVPYFVVDVVGTDGDIETKAVVVAALNDDGKKVFLQEYSSDLLPFTNGTVEISVFTYIPGGNLERQMTEYLGILSVEEFNAGTFEELKPEELEVAKAQLAQDFGIPVPLRHAFSNALTNSSSTIVKSSETGEYYVQFATTDVHGSDEYGDWYEVDLGIGTLHYRIDEPNESAGGTSSPRLAFRPTRTNKGEAIAQWGGLNSPNRNREMQWRFSYNEALSQVLSDDLYRLDALDAQHTEWGTFLMNLNSLPTRVRTYMSDHGVGVDSLGGVHILFPEAITVDGSYGEELIPVTVFIGDPESGVSLTLHIPDYSVYNRNYDGKPFEVSAFAGKEVIAVRLGLYEDIEITFNDGSSMYVHGNFESVQWGDSVTSAGTISFGLKPAPYMAE